MSDLNTVIEHCKGPQVGTNKRGEEVHYCPLPLRGTETHACVCPHCYALVEVGGILVTGCNFLGVEVKPYDMYSDAHPLPTQE